jgi:hypothetical protein
MKKAIHLFSIVLIFSVLSSCGKQGFTRVEGRVLEKGSNKPVANANVIFYQCVAGEGFGSSAICTEIDTAVTDTNGSYVFTREEENNDVINYRIDAFKGNYSSEGLTTAQSGKTTKNVDFVMRANAWVKFHIKNVNPFDENDLIIAPWDKEFYGDKVDVTYTIGGSSFLGNFKNNIHWVVERNLQRNLYKDSVFCKALDTVFYEIKY